jgi:hypothetical protein
LVTGGDQLGTRSLLEEVACVASSHAAKARDGNLELANHCVVCNVERYGKRVKVNSRRGNREDVLEDV